MRRLTRIQKLFALRRELREVIENLAPWYQPINFGLGVRATAIDKNNSKITNASLDRGLKKWRRFIRPNIPFDLENKRVLEVGCNAGIFLVECAREGAREVVGIEKDEHYYQQAKFVSDAFSELHGKSLPIRLYKGSMEAFDFEGLGRVDLALFLASIYHIGKTSEYDSMSLDDVRSLQLQTIRSVSKIARFLLFQGNARKDEGRGKGRDSLIELVKAAGLRIAKESIYDHHRGYILLAESPFKQHVRCFPLHRMISKYFLPASMSAEASFVEAYVSDEQGFDPTNSRYFRLRTGLSDWTAPGEAKLPANLICTPRYWLMPWAHKLRKQDERRVHARIRSFPGICDGFVRLIESIEKNGFCPEGDEGIPGYMLVHPVHGEVFQYTDGNHRLGMLAAMVKSGKVEEFDIPIDVRQTIYRDRLLQYPLANQLVEEGYFTESDALSWFDNAFWFLHSDRERTHASSTA